MNLGTTHLKMAAEDSVEQDLISEIFLRDIFLEVLLVEGFGGFGILQEEAMSNPGADLRYTLEISLGKQHKE